MKVEIIDKNSQLSEKYKMIKVVTIEFCVEPLNVVFIKILKGSEILMTTLNSNSNIYYVTVSILNVKD